jgi:hypothetical protein
MASVTLDLFHKLINIEQRLYNSAGILVSSPPSLASTGRVLRSRLTQRWNAMTDYLATIPLLAIQRLRCQKCQKRMTLARILPGPSGFELRAFDCSTCDHVEKIAIASDPMKSGNVGWLIGELRSPS